MWFGMTYGNVIWYSLMQREVPGELLGRAASLDWALSLALAPLGTIAGGAAATVFGPVATTIVGGVVTLFTVLVLVIPGVTAIDRRSRNTQTESELAMVA